MTMAIRMLALISLLVGNALAQADPIEQVLALPQASLVVGTTEQPLIQFQANRPMIPASTLKLVTALAALERWGPAHHFTTELYLDDELRLWVRGRGDPYLVAEELDALVQALRRQGLTQVSGLGVDASLYPSTLRVPGRSRTDNPYDAPLTALAVNFNTVSLRVRDQGIHSGEPQTPLTATARQLGRGLGPGTHRVNLGTREQALKHAGEVLTAKLEQAGIRVTGAVVIGTAPASARRFAVHANSRSLAQVVRAMLKYSNNFVANNLFLMLGEHQGQTSFPQARQHMEHWVRERFGWRDVRIEDGAGLSRDNRLSGAQLIELLGDLAPYRELLPEQDGEPRVRAKTGTLSGVSGYAGFVQRGGHWVPFSLLINQPAPYNLRLHLARALVEAPRLAAP